MYANRERRQQKPLASGENHHQGKLVNEIVGNSIRIGHVKVKKVIKKHILLTLCVISFLFGMFTIMFGQKPELVVRTGHVLEVHSFSMRADGRILATAGGVDHTIRLWDVVTGLEIASFDAPGYVSSVSFSPDGKKLASGGLPPAKIIIWDVASRTQEKTLDGNAAYFIAFGPVGDVLVSGEINKTTKLLNVATGREITTLKSKDISAAVFNGEGSLLVTGSRDGAIGIWNATTCVELRSWKGHAKKVNTVAVSSDGKTVASGSDGETIKVWDLATGEQRQTLNLLGPDVLMFISPDQSSESASLDGDRIIVGFTSVNSVKLKDAATGHDIATVGGHSAFISSLKVSPNGNFLAFASLNAIKLWDLASNQQLRTLKGNEGFDNSLAFSRSEKMLALSYSQSVVKEIKLWDVVSGRELSTLGQITDEEYVLLSLRLDSRSPDEKIRAAARASAAGEREEVLFSPDGKTLASKHEDETSLWNLRSGKKFRTFSGGGPL